MNSIRGIRSLRTASSPPLRALLSPSSSQHRQFSSRPTTASHTSPSRTSLLAASQTIRPRIGPVCPSCHHKLPTRRNFSLASFTNTAVDVTEATISQLHHVTHTPWYITLPLVALSINLLFRLPLSVHSRNLVYKRAQLNPILRSWANVHTQNILKERQQLKAEQAKRLASPAGRDLDEPPVDISVESVQAEVIKRHTKTANGLYAKFGVPQWKLYGNILAMPPWLIVIEAIRRMCGAPQGLLGMIFRRAPAETAEAADSVQAAASAVSSTAATPPADAIALLSEPSLTTGGCLWFPDLTVADPYHVLPFALSAMLVVNILPSTDAGRRMLFGLPPADGSITMQHTMGSRFQRTLLVMSASVGFVTFNFPAAIHLYWLSSAGTTYGITRLLRCLKPMPNDPPLRQHREGPWIVPKAPAEKQQ